MYSNGNTVRIVAVFYHVPDCTDRKAVVWNRISLCILDVELT